MVDVVGITTLIAGPGPGPEFGETNSRFHRSVSVTTRRILGRSVATVRFLDEDGGCGEICESNTIFLDSHSNSIVLFVDFIDT